MLNCQQLPEKTAVQESTALKIPYAPGRTPVAAQNPTAAKVIQPGQVRVFGQAPLLRVLLLLAWLIIHG